MSTTPITFNERKISYTVLGKNRSTLPPLVSVLVLSRGIRHYLASFFNTLISMGFNSIVLVDDSQRCYELETLSSQFPDILFLLPSEHITIGEMINVGMGEIEAETVFVLWNDMILSTRITEQKILEAVSDPKTICAPVFLLDAKNNNMTVQKVPTLTKMDFSTEQFLCYKDNTNTIYPYDFAGIYKRKKFIEAGGFDCNIKNPYWQTLDFGFRSYLWGFNLVISTDCKIQYAGISPVEDISADNSYTTFYLKNLAPVIGKKGIYLPFHLIFSHIKKSGLNLLLAIKHFNAIRTWVKLNKNRFVKSAQQLIDEWEPKI